MCNTVGKIPIHAGVDRNREIEKLEDKWCDKEIDRWRKKKTHTEL